MLGLMHFVLRHVVLRHFVLRHVVRRPFVLGHFGLMHVGFRNFALGHFGTLAFLYLGILDLDNLCTQVVSVLRHFVLRRFWNEACCT